MKRTNARVNELLTKIGGLATTSSKFIDQYVTHDVPLSGIDVDLITVGTVEEIYRILDEIEIASEESS